MRVIWCRGPDASQAISPTGWFRSQPDNGLFVRAHTSRSSRRKRSRRCRICWRPAPVRREEGNRIHWRAGCAVDCGGPLVKSSAGSGSSRRDYLHCKRHIQEKTACSRHSVRLDLLEQEIAGRIHARLTQYLSAAEIADLCQSAPGPLPASGLPRLYAALTRCERALHTLYFDRADGIIGREQFGLLNRSCLAEREQLIRKIAALAPSEYCPSKPASDTFPLRPFVWTLIEWVGVGERDPVTGEQRVEIHWNF